MSFIPMVLIGTTLYMMRAGGPLGAGGAGGAMGRMSQVSAHWHCDTVTLTL